LSVGLGEKGIVVHCKVECSYADICAALNVPQESLFYDEDAREAPRPSNAERLPSEAALAAFNAALLSSAGQAPAAGGVARLDMADAREAARRCRRHPADAARPQRRGRLVNVLRYLPGQNRGDQPKLLAARGRPRDLFPRPEAFDSEEVWIVEGEPDAVTGHELGLTAFGTPGTNGWRTSWAQRFRGRVCVVCFDCDGPGRAAAQKVAGSLVEEAREVRVVDLAPERDDGFDLTRSCLRATVGIAAAWRAGRSGICCGWRSGRRRCGR
jgi:hypothetical protein